MDLILSRVGWVQDVVASSRTRRILDGHLRVALAKQLGQRVRVTLVDVSEEEEAAILSTFDPIAAMAVRDTIAMSSLAEDVTRDGFADLLEHTWSDHQRALAEHCAEHTRKTATQHATGLGESHEHEARSKTPNRTVLFSPAQWETVTEACYKTGIPNLTLAVLWIWERFGAAEEATRKRGTP